MKNKKNILIGGLLALVLVMAVGYAAFATNLNINGTSTIDSKWDVHIKDGGVTVNTSSYATSVSQSKVSDLTAEFECNLTDPGKSTISYDIIVENTGTFDAKLSSINLTGTTTYVDATTSGIAVDDVIAKNGGTDTLTVTVSYKNVSVPPTLSSDRTAHITVTLNYVQSDSAPTPSPSPEPASYNGTVYAWNTTAVTIGTSTLSDLVSTKTAQPYYTSAAAVMEASGYPFYNMYTIEDNTITEGYACQTFGISGFTPVCVQGGTDSNNNSYYNYDSSPGNHATLTALNENTTFTGSPNNGHCGLYSNHSSCSAGGSTGWTVAANVNGQINASDSGGDNRCSTYGTGSLRSGCIED